MRLRYFRYQDSWRIQRSFQTFPTFYFTPFNQCFTSGICVGFAMFYYILIFFYCVLPIYLLFFRSAWELICFRSIPRWIALGAALESPLSGPAKRVAAFLGDGGEGLPGKKRWGRSNPRWKFPPYFVWYFFLPRSFCWKAQMVFSEHILTVGLYVRVWQAWSRVFRRSTWKGLVLIQPVPWLNHAWPCTYRGDGLIIWGGVSKIWEPGCFIETFKITVFDCLIVCLPLLPGFEYYTLTLIKPPSQQYLAQDQHFLKLATSCQSATFA